jgi:hypothetical protein
MTTPTKRLLCTLAALGVMALTACSKDKGPTCAQASAKFMSMLDAEHARDGDPGRLKTARANRPALQDRLFKACEEQKWSLLTRQCILDAKTAAETSSCSPPSALQTESQPSGNAEGPE